LSKDFFQKVEELLRCESKELKLEGVESFYKEHTEYKKSSSKKILFQSPSYSSICKVVHSKEIQKRKGLKSQESRAQLLHSIAHIEYSAIDLALDACYRFEHMPESFYEEWLLVALEEVRHFRMLEGLLMQLGYSYGDFAVHSYLFDISMKTPSLLERMAAVPRYLEASGLDANPLIIEKLKRFDDEFAKKIVEALKVILDEEIDHVRKGDRWFIYACEKEGVSKECYFDIVKKVFEKEKYRAYINKEARLKAGFSAKEIEWLEA
jgi:uncharacterized ferritin-like protein (DUF455 family)